jgi:hypothetical protein
MPATVEAIPDGPATTVYPTIPPARMTPAVRVIPAAAVMVGEVAVAAEAISGRRR